MGKESGGRAKLQQAVINYVRENHKDYIDRAYEYFWDENSPEDFLSKTALEIGFINFEDWLVADYRVNDCKETFIDLYAKCTSTLDNDDLSILGKIKDSVLSLYEVVSVSENNGILVRDLLLEGEYNLNDKTLAGGGIESGSLFAARLLELDGGIKMSGCVYPYGAGYKDTILRHISSEFRRYKKNVNPDGAMRDYLKEYGDVFNIIWITFIIRQSQGKG